MKSPMLSSEHQAAVQRALALGRGGEPASVSELIEMLKLPSHEVRRLAASAIGKLAEYGADPALAVPALLELALTSQHPQVQQYAIRAIRKYGADAAATLPDLRDLTHNPVLKSYVREAAEGAIAAVEQGIADKAVSIRYRCQRCSASMTPEEASRSDAAFQRPYCDRCFDEVYLERRNFETKVELQKTVAARDGTLVQSHGERLIAEWLTANQIAYRYDSKFRIIGEFQIRPDFYLPELDIYIEYWGLDTPQYKMSMYKKQILYQQEGKSLVSVYPKDLSNLNEVLQAKVMRK